MDDLTRMIVGDRRVFPRFLLSGGQGPGCAKAQIPHRFAGGLAGGRLLQACLLFLLAVSHHPAHDATYYVSPSNSSDSYSGSESMPWKTVGHGVSHIDPGDTLLVMPGEYHERISLAAGPTPKLAGITSESQRAVIKSKFSRAAVLGGSGVTGSIVSIDGLKYITIQGFKIVNQNVLDGGYGIQAGNCAHLTLEDNEVVNYASANCNIIHLGNPCDYAIVRNNTCYFYSTGGVTKGNGITIQDGVPGTGSSDILVEGNEIFNCPGNYPLQIYFWDSRNVNTFYTNAVIRYNTIHNSSGGIMLRNHKNMRLYGNLIYDCTGRQPIAMGEGFRSTFASNSVVYNNTIYTPSPNYAVIDNVEFDSVSFYNNIIVGPTCPIYIRFSNPHCFIDYNFYQGATAPCGAQRGANDMDNTRHGDIAFIDSVNKDFRLRGTSPAIDNGHNFSGIDTALTDLDGNARPIGSLDRGAYEYRPSNTTSPGVRATAAEQRSLLGGSRLVCAANGLFVVVTTRADTRGSVTKCYSMQGRLLSPAPRHFRLVAP